MNKKQEIAIGIGVAILLVGYFIYQVAYGMTMGPNGTMTITSGNISATLRAPPGSSVNNFTIVPEENTSYAYPPQTITYSWEPAASPDCSNCYFQTFTIHDGPTRDIVTVAIRRHIQNIQTYAPVERYMKINYVI